MLNYCIKMDLWGDYCRRIQMALRGKGIEPPVDGREAVYWYFNLQKKAIPARPRRVLYSDVFCCPPAHQTALDRLVSKLIAGEDVSTYLSKQAKDANEPDLMLYDWGVYHLHLGAEMEEDDKYIKRTKELLFLRIDNEAAYLLGIFRHREWTRQEIVRIIHRNWPDTIAHSRIHGVDSLITGDGQEVHLTDNEYAALQKCGVTTAVEVEKGTYYMLLGGGYSATGHSSEIVDASNRIHNELMCHELQIEANISEIAKWIEQEWGKPHGSTYCFKLWYEHDEWCIIELISMVIIRKVIF